MKPTIMNVTARISELRNDGHQIFCTGDIDNPSHTKYMYIGFTKPEEKGFIDKAIEKFNLMFKH